MSESVLIFHSKSNRILDCFRRSFPEINCLSYLTRLRLCLLSEFLYRVAEFKLNFQCLSCEGYLIKCGGTVMSLMIFGLVQENLLVCQASDVICIPIDPMYHVNIIMSQIVISKTIHQPRNKPKLMKN